MTRRNRFHSALMSRIGQLIGDWLDAQPEPRGEVYNGEAGVYLRRNPEQASSGWMSVYLQPGSSPRQTGDSTMIDGIPTLAVEILSPSNKEEEVNEKTDAYLAVWRAARLGGRSALSDGTCLRPGQPAEMFNTTHTLLPIRTYRGSRSPSPNSSAAADYTSSNFAVKCRSTAGASTIPQPWNPPPVLENFANGLNTLFDLAFLFTPPRTPRPTTSYFPG